VQAQMLVLRAARSAARANLAVNLIPRATGLLAQIPMERREKIAEGFVPTSFDVPAGHALLEGPLFWIAISFLANRAAAVTRPFAKKFVHVRSHERAFPQKP
jgi:hypothetical protein